MKKLLTKLKIMLLVSVISLLLFVGISYAVGNSSSVKIDKATYKPAKSSSGNPSVSCDVQNSGDGSTTVALSFNSAKRGSKTALVTLNLFLSNDEYNNLMSGDVINFQHGDSFSFASQIPKVFLTFSEGNVKKTKTSINSVSKGTPISSDSGYSVNGSVEIINKRADGCVDVDFNAMVQNATVSRTVTALDSQKNCIKSTNSTKLKTIPSTTVLGTLYPEKSTAMGSTSGTTLCDLPSGFGTSSGSSIPGFGGSSGSSIPGLGSSGFTIPDFGNSSGFTIPDFGNSSGFTIPDFGDFGDGSDSSGSDGSGIQ